VLNFNVAGMDRQQVLRQVPKSPQSILHLQNYFHYKSNLAILSFCMMTVYSVKSIHCLCLQTVRTFLLFSNFYHMDGFCINEDCMYTGV
jgi:hypothetical protein